MNLLEVSDRQAWDTFVSQHPYGHPLQLWGWGATKEGNGWSAHRLALVDGETWLGGAEVLLWRIPKLGKYVAYVPRGPVVGPGSKAAQTLLEQIVGWARSHNALYVRIEPAWTTGVPKGGWVRAKHHLQMNETYTIDLHKPEDELLEPMSRKHRQYIRKSERDGIRAQRVSDDDLGPMFALYRGTAQRAGFGIHNPSYYEVLHRELDQHSYLYYAYFEGKPIAFLWLAAAGRTAYELYGGVNEAGQELKANYYLKWQAMMDMKAAGFQTYDFNGRLNEGVSRFKDGFGPDSTDYIGTYDYPINKVGYQVWEHLWPVAKPLGRRVLQAVRRRG